MNAARKVLYRLVDELPDADVDAARRMLEGLVHSVPEELTAEQDAGLVAALRSVREGRVHPAEKVMEEARALLAKRTP